MAWHAAASAAATARATRANRPLLMPCSPAAHARWAESERQQEQAEGGRGSPRRTGEGGSERLREPENERSEQGAGYGAHAAEHADREHQADVLAPYRRLHRLDHDQERAGDPRGHDRERE